MAHDHARSAAAAHHGRLAAVFAVTVVVLVVELVGAALSGSLALLADAGHVLADGAGVGLALLAIRFAARPATPQRTFGYYRLEILAAVVNAVLLFGVAGFVLVEAWRRLTEPPAVAYSTAPSREAARLVRLPGALRRFTMRPESIDTTPISGAAGEPIIRATRSAPTGVIGARLSSVVSTSGVGSLPGAPTRTCAVSPRRCVIR